MLIQWTLILNNSEGDLRDRLSKEAASRERMSNTLLL